MVRGEGGGRFGLIISFSQNEKPILEEIQSIFGGGIYTFKSKKWKDNESIQITNKESILSLLEYFKNNPSYSRRRFRLYLVNKFYELKEMPKGIDPTIFRYYISGLGWIRQ